ncbi:asparaginase-domain-containing protein [Durotheca rogersii]|uniref:asparaginase-domain-containing protein n=1 Tax=Durotheca rogersii TaxID=419775 RepID=UPI0022205176|nr:asparaginase-domain-containing protein [Durotheca rogersii]KAI5867181.1 asparaginase-domain-containing protein [Durotheca rogersii]
MGAFVAVDSAGAEPSTYPESRVLIIITGGTICMRPSAGGLVPVNGFLENAMAPRPSFNDMSERVPLTIVKDGTKITVDSLRTPPSSYSRHIRYGALEFAPLLDSSSISSVGWTQIARAIAENYHLFDGFVVLHGTDSLAYSASALSFMLEDLGKPVVLTGSQASIFALQSDAVDNLLGSLIVAGTFVIPEVCLFFHHALFRGNRTTKVSASAFDAFASPNCPPLARVTSLGLDVNWALVRRPTRIACFRVTPYLDTARVACLRIFPGIRPEMVDAVLRLPGLRGLVLETFGMGNAPEVGSGDGDGGDGEGSLARAIRDAVAHRGVVVVNVSQCTSGVVSPLYAPGFALGRAGVVFGHDLTSEAALTKLSYLLALAAEGALPKASAPPETDAETIGRLMSTSLRGELTELARPSFTHPAASAAGLRGDDDDGRNNNDGAGAARLGKTEAAFAALGYAIAAGDLAAVREMLDSEAAAGADNGSTVRGDAGEAAVVVLPGAGAPSPARGEEPAAAPPPPAGLLRGADYIGNTAVHLAAMGPEVAVLEELLRRGASVHARNRADNTPLYLAERTAGGGGECARLLREAGALLWGEEEVAGRR